MQVATINVNGIRAATKVRSVGNQGLLTWLSSCEAEVVCLQETRASDQQVAECLAPILAEGWQLFTAEPIQKGRNGVAILTKIPVEKVQIGFGDNEFKQAGRYLEVHFPTLVVASLYLPSGEVGTARQVEKMNFCRLFLEYLQQIDRDKAMLICGDWNIGHTELDIKNWKANQKKSGFLPEERQWLTEVINTGWVDVVRELFPNQNGPYSWWSYRGKAFDNDAGWRIDYQFATPNLAATATHAKVDKAASYDLRWSDHSPVTVTYEYF